jgi:hypothetical protein
MSRQSTFSEQPTPWCHCFGLGVSKNISVILGESCEAYPAYCAPVCACRSVWTAWQLAAERLEVARVGGAAELDGELVVHFEV